MLVFQHFYFRQLRKINIGDAAVDPGARSSLLCVADQFGLVFAGSRRGKRGRGGHAARVGLELDGCCLAGVLVVKVEDLHRIDRDPDLGKQNITGRMYIIIYCSSKLHH